MESNTRSIMISLVAVISLSLIALIAAILIPFNVEQKITLRDIEGTVELLSPDGAATAVDTTTELKTGQTVLVQPSSSATIVFFDTGGHALITGPASLTVVEIYRRATGPGHLLDSLNRDYVLTIDQTRGSVRYLFDHATPAFEEIDFTIQLPEGNYTPSTPCWTVTIDAADQTIADPMDCPL